MLLTLHHFVQQWQKWAETLIKSTLKFQLTLLLTTLYKLTVTERPTALQLNMDLEFERNAERYQFLSWAQKAYDNYRAVPPATGIVHQVNLEYLANVVHALKTKTAHLKHIPDTLVGTDSHTTMINGIGVLGWGVGGIEAEAGMLGQPSYFPIPEVIGVKLVGELPNGTTATDLALKVTQILRAHGVVGKFVEFFGPGVSELATCRPCNNCEHGT